MGTAGNGPRGAIIFDGDDTLWQTQILYDQAKEDFFNLMVSEGFNRESVCQKFSEIDVANVKKYGFSKTRFPNSMMETYKFFCEQIQMPAKTDVLKRARAIGNSVFQRQPFMNPNVRHILKNLGKHYRIYLYTAGDKKVQSKRIKALGVRQLFEAIIIPDIKNESKLRKVIIEKNLDIKSTWMVGNSLKSDIKPALNLGLRCIWIRGGSWEYDHADISVDTVRQVSNIDEIENILTINGEMNLFTSTLSPAVL
jgi:putative hydrolase of the HAD superfamily